MGCPACLSHIEGVGSIPVWGEGLTWGEEKCKLHTEMTIKACFSSNYNGVC